MKLELKIVDLLNRNRKEFTINEMAKTLKQHYSLVHRFTGRLAKDKVIIKKKIGNSYVCSLNLENEKTITLLVLSEIERKDEFYNKSRKLKLILEDFVSSVKEEFKGKLYSIVLFGSYAKDRAVKGSDIDVFILVKDKISADKIIREIYSKYGMEINVVMLDLKELEQQKNKEFFKEIISNHYIIYGTDRFTEIMK